MNDAKKIEKIRAILANDGRSWDHNAVGMLQEIEDVVRLEKFEFKCVLTEDILEKMIADPKVESEVRENLIRRLDVEMAQLLSRCRS